VVSFSNFDLVFLSHALLSPVVHFAHLPSPVVLKRSRPFLNIPKDVEDLRRYTFDDIEGAAQGGVACSSIPNTTQNTLTAARWIVANFSATTYTWGVGEVLKMTKEGEVMILHRGNHFCVGVSRRGIFWELVCFLHFYMD
jgi:hypothetical protein